MYVRVYRAVTFDGRGPGEKVARPWPTGRGKRNAAELRKGWLCSIHTLSLPYAVHTSALILPVCVPWRGRAQFHTYTGTRIATRITTRIPIRVYART